MTIKNESLGDRLNDFKNNPPSETDTNIESVKKSLIEFFSTITTFSAFIGRSIIFGYSLKIIFNTNWNFLAFLCIGISLNLFFQYIKDIIHKK